MFDRILRRMRKFVQTSRYVATTHAVEEIEADGLTIFDVEHCILTGKIVEKQKDRDTSERKYLIEGRTVDGDQVVTVAKIAQTGKLVIITVYRV